jgi:hypothetical protein
MKLTTLLVTATLVIGLAGAAHGANQVAGPLSTTTGCSCLIVNVTNSTKVIHVQLLNKGGALVPGGELGPEPLDAGEAHGVTAPGVGNIHYCKFINAAAASFRATMICEGTAVPAR